MSSTKRNIVVYYFIDAARTAVVSGTTRWYKYARSANQSAYDAMVENLYGARVAVVYDDDTGKDLFVIVRTADDKVETTYRADEVKKSKYRATSRDPLGDFTQKLSKRAKARLTHRFMGLPRRNRK